MTKLSKEQIEEWRSDLVNAEEVGPWTPLGIEQINALCDLALASLTPQATAEAGGFRECKAACKSRLGESAELDCDFPLCSGGWRAYAEHLEEQLMTQPATITPGGVQMVAATPSQKGCAAGPDVYLRPMNVDVERMERIPSECFPLGDFIQDELRARNWTTADLATRMGDTEKERSIWGLTVDLIIHCSDQPMKLGQETALKLGAAFDVSPDYFLNLNNIYNKWLALRSRDETIELCPYLNDEGHVSDRCPCCAYNEPAGAAPDTEGMKEAIERLTNWVRIHQSYPDDAVITHSCAEDLLRMKHFRALVRALRSRESEKERLADCLNHAVTELTRAALSEDFDSEDCMNCVERIKDTLTPMGKTSDWHALQDWYDRLCAACGVDNGDEIDIVQMVEQRLRSREGMVSVPREPTEAMVIAADDVFCGGGDIAAIYKAMLSSRPGGTTEGKE